MANGDQKDLVPASIVQLIFNQVKQSTDVNTETIKGLTIAINEMVKLLTVEPTRKDVLIKMSDLVSHYEEKDKELKVVLANIKEDYTRKREISDNLVKEHANRIISCLERISKDTLERLVEKEKENKTEIATAAAKIDKLIEILKSAIVAISVALTIIGGLHFLMDWHVSKSVENEMKTAVEQIIKSRESSFSPTILQKKPEEVKDENKELP